MNNFATWCPTVHINTDRDLVYKNHEKASEFPKFVIYKSIKIQHVD